MILCLGITKKVSYYCSGVSPYTLWEIYSATGITMNISTSQCNFNSTPLYFTSLGGIGGQFRIVGYTGIYYPTKNSFQIYAGAWLGTTDTTILLNYTKFQQWDVNWLGVLE